MPTARDRDRTDAVLTGHELALQLVATKWSLPILVALSNGPVRRHRLKHRLRVINNDRLDATLTRQLRWGLIEKVWIAGARTDEPGYAITPLGASLLCAFEPVARWQVRHRSELVNKRLRWDQAHPASN